MPEIQSYWVRLELNCYLSVVFRSSESALSLVAGASRGVDGDDFIE